VAGGIGDDRLTLWPLIFRGLVAFETGDRSRATAYYERALDLARTVDDRRLVEAALNNLGVIAMVEGDFARAYELYADALARAREIGSEDEVILLLNLADASQELRRLDDAVRATREGVALAQRSESLNQVEMAFQTLAHVARACGDAAAGAMFLGVAMRVREQLGGELTPDGVAWLGEVVAKLHEELSEEEYGGALEAGRRLSLSAAFDQAMRYLASEAGTTPSRAG
jgi:tetratricopeptide (TPR) repeat protein